MISIPLSCTASAELFDATPAPQALPRFAPSYPTGPCGLDLSPTAHRLGLAATVRMSEAAAFYVHAGVLTQLEVIVALEQAATAAAVPCHSITLPLAPALCAQCLPTADGAPVIWIALCRELLCHGGL